MIPETPSLKIDWATHESAEYACKNWHYSKILPTGKLVKIGVWENKVFIGVVLFSRGASPHLGTKFFLGQDEICELTRVALTKHKTEVTRIVAIALKFLKRHCPGLRLVVSFADPEQGHAGGIYKGGNWVYSGTSGETIEYFVEGRWRHVRGAYAFVRGREHLFRTRKRLGKHRFLMALDPKLNSYVNKFSVPYASEAKDSRHADSIGETRGGLSPTQALHSAAKQRFSSHD